MLVESRRLQYNHRRLRSSLDYMTPVAFAATYITWVSATPGPQKYTTDIVDDSLIVNENKNHNQKVANAPTDLPQRLPGRKQEQGQI